MRAHQRIVALFADDALLGPIVRATMHVCDDEVRQIESSPQRIAIENHVLEVHPRPAVVTPRLADVVHFGALCANVLFNGLEVFANRRVHRVGRVIVVVETVVAPFLAAGARNFAQYS